MTIYETMIMLLMLKSTCWLFFTLFRQVQFNKLWINTVLSVVWFTFLKQVASHYSIRTNNLDHKEDNCLQDQSTQ